jgi:RsiW-degrading membrane proteinase PrsW (M82 family)
MTSSFHPDGQPIKTSLHWPSLIQLILSLMAAFILFGIAVVIVISAIIPYFSRGASTDPTESFLVAASLVFAGVLVLPSAWYAWKTVASPERQPSRRQEPRGFGLILTIVVIILDGAALWLGNWSSLNNRLTWLLLPPLNIIATGLPALWLVYIGTRGLIPGAPRRRWGVFASGLVLGPFIILILEIMLLAVMGILALVWVMLNPSLSNQLNSLASRLHGAGTNLESILQILTPILLNPGIIFLGFAFISVLVPMIEELFKPIGVWFLAGQKITPAQGFGYGVLSGAGFGLFENLGNTSGGATDWALLASSRISTLLLHSFTAGLVGWALVSAWSERRYLRLIIAYVVAVVVHGLWNGLALLSAASQLQSYTNISLPTYINQLDTFSTWGIVGLGIIVLLLFVGANSILRRGAPSVATTPAENDRIIPPFEDILQPVVDKEPAQQASKPDTDQPRLPGDNPLHLQGETPHLPNSENPNKNTGD